MLWLFIAHFVHVGAKLLLISIQQVHWHQNQCQLKSKYI